MTAAELIADLQDHLPDSVVRVATGRSDGDEWVPASVYMGEDGVTLWIDVERDTPDKEPSG